MDRCVVFAAIAFISWLLGMLSAVSIMDWLERL